MNETGTSTVKVTSNIWGVTTDTWPDYTLYQPTPIHNVACRNYKCPCGGEFNVASYSSEKGAFVYRCPFCGKIMEGLR